MELKCYLNKAIDEYLGKMGTITTKKIMNYVYSEYNLDADAQEINSILKERTSILEIMDGIFVEKNFFFSFIKEIDTHKLKSQIEFQYLVSINEEQMTKILDIIKFYKNEKHNENGQVNQYAMTKFNNNDKVAIKNEYKTEKNIIKESYLMGEEKKIEWTYGKIIDFGMEYGYINSSWLGNLDYSLEKEVQDYFEAIEEIEEKGIKVKY